MKIVTPLKK